MDIRIKPLLYGIYSFLPFENYLRLKSKKSGGSDNADYCYSIWLRHVKKIQANTSNSCHFDSLLELGPGDSHGIGYCALLCGAKKYYAVDAVASYDKFHNLKIFNQLVVFFQKQIDPDKVITHNRVKPKISDLDFPKDIFSKSFLKKSLNPERLDEIRRNILNGHGDFIEIIDYKDISEKEISVELIISQAVMEHVENPDKIYKILSKFLSRSGLMTHIIDFKSHGVCKTKNGHFFISKFLWFLIRGKRDYLLNRYTPSKHKEIISQIETLDLVFEENYPYSSSDNLVSKELTKNNSDYLISSSHLIAKKKT